jgi:hypothetical protein
MERTVVFYRVCSEPTMVQSQEVFSMGSVPRLYNSEIDFDLTQSYRVQSADFRVEEAVGASQSSEFVRRSAGGPGPW